MRFWAGLSELPFHPVARSALLAILCLLLYLPGQTTIPPFDRDEARFVQATKQMVASGDYVDIRFQDEARHKKPIGLYWLQSLAVKAAGTVDQVWAYRAVSWMAALFAVTLTGAFAGRLFGAQAGLAAGVLLATCLLMGVEARMAKTDAAMLLTIVLAQFMLAKAYLDGPLSRFEAAVFWLALGVGTLIKGPIAPMVPLFTILVLVAYERRWEWLCGLETKRGALLYLLVVLPWLLLITWKTGGAFWAESVGNDLISKAASVQESHGGPPGYYLLTFFFTFWPWAPLLLPAGYYAWKERENPSVLFCVAWIVPFWLVFEFFPTKLMHYTLPVFPALAMLMGGMFASMLVLPRGLRLTVDFLAIALLAAVAAALPLLPLAVGKAANPSLSTVAWLRDYPPSFTALLAAVILLGFSFVAWRQRGATALVLLVAGLICFYGAVYGRLFPSTDGLWISRSAAALINPQRATCKGPFMAVGYNEPSLVFLTDRSIKFVTAANAEKIVQAWPCSLVLAETALSAPGFTSVAIGEVKGFNYARGKAAHLTLFRLTREGAL